VDTFGRSRSGQHIGRAISAGQAATSPQHGRPSSPLDPSRRGEPAVDGIGTTGGGRPERTRQLTRPALRPGRRRQPDKPVLRGPTTRKPPYRRVEMDGDGCLDFVEGVRCVIVRKFMPAPKPAQCDRVGRSLITPEHYPAADSRRWASRVAAASTHALHAKVHCLILVLLLCLGTSTVRRHRRRPRRRAAISLQLSFDL
jgi:hypothetical protein